MVKHNAPQLLVVRFSSFGDIVHAIGVPASFKQSYPGAAVHWLVRADLKDLISTHPAIDKVIEFPRGDGLKGLLRLAWSLGRQGNYTHVYDAHNNVRSRVFCFIFGLRTLIKGHTPRFSRRPKNRLLRWMLFKLRISLLPKPFRGADSFHAPLTGWGLRSTVPDGPQFFTSAQVPAPLLDQALQLRRPLIVAAPSAAWEMKRWPIANWKQLMSLLPDVGWVFVGGQEDTFINELVRNQKNALNFAGKLSLAQSSALLSHCDLVIANDTGIMHVADQMERPTIALIGPTAFGYPSHSTSEVLEIELACKPCSKDGSGKCINSVYQRCLADLTPETVASAARAKLISKVSSASLESLEPSK